MKPLMSKKEIRIFERTLLKYGNKGKTVRVLEWGSGGSTVYYTKFMRANNISYSWQSVEYNKIWYEKVLSMLEGDPNTKVTLFDVGNNNLRQRYIPMDEYVNFPKTLEQTFDIIFIDGRKRRRCLLEAVKLIDKNGVVFLHDAQRKFYQCAFDSYANHTFLSVNLWRGKVNDVVFLKSSLNLVQSLFFKIYYRLFVKPINLFYGHLRLKFRLTKDCLSNGATIGSKIKMFFIIFLLALKKKGLYIPFRTTILLGSPLKSFEFYIKDYNNASDFYQAIIKKTLTDI